MPCQDCTKCPGYEQSRTSSPRLHRDAPCTGCGHQLSDHEDGQARSIAGAMAPGATISHGPPPAGSLLAQLIAKRG